MSVAFLFPGQGSQHPGMLHALPDHPEVHRTLADAGRILGHDAYDLEREEALRSTVAVQLALYIAGVATARALAAEGARPDAVAGLSIGAFAAAVSCGALPFEPGVHVVRKRAELMETAYSHGYGMAAIVGLSEAQLSRIVARISTSEEPVYVANLNAPRQVVIAGSDQGMISVLEAAKQTGARKAERLPVSVPSHCPLLNEQAHELMQFIQNIPFNNPICPYVSNRRARPLRAFEAIREDLANNMAYPVRWHDAVTVLIELGSTLLVEMNPGKILTDLAGEVFPWYRAVAVEHSQLTYVVGFVKKVQAEDQ